MDHIDQTESNDDGWLIGLVSWVTQTVAASLSAPRDVELTQPISSCLPKETKMK